jgi:hypothetical protein
MQQQKQTTRVVASPTRAFLFIAILLFLISPLFLITDKDGVQPWFMMVPFLMGAVSLLLYDLRARVIADADGLRWRGIFGGWKRASWADVDDYFRVLDSMSGRIGVVVFRDGRRLKLGSDLNDLKRLETMISEQATNAKASGWLIRSKEGTIVGTHVFSYSEKAIRSQKIAMWAMLGILSSFVIGVTILAILEKKLNQTLELRICIGLFWTMLVFGGVWCVRGARRAISDIQGRLSRKERIEADEQGLTFLREGESQQVLWSALESMTRKQLQANGAMLNQYTLKTESAEFSFNSGVSNFATLCGMIALYAPQLTVNAQSQARRPNELLASTEWDGGRRIFHYRTRSNRSGLAMLWTVPLLCLLGIGWIVAMCIHYGMNPREVLQMEQLRVVFGLAIVAILVWAFLLWRYKAARLVLDKESITSFGLFGRRQVFFEDIVVIGRDELGYYLETKDGKRLIRWGANLADLTEFLSELERRAGVTLGV